MSLDTGTIRHLREDASQSQKIYHTSKRLLRYTNPPNHMFIYCDRTSAQRHAAHANSGVRIKSESVVDVTMK